MGIDGFVLVIRKLSLWAGLKASLLRRILTSNVALARSVVCGQHALNLAETFVLKINAMRDEHWPGLHLFIAAPHAFTYFLGQTQPGSGKSTLFDYGFEGANDGGYSLGRKRPFPRPSKTKIRVVRVRHMSYLWHFAIASRNVIVPVS